MAAYMNAGMISAGATSTMTALAASPALSLHSSAADVKGHEPVSPETKAKKLFRPSELPIYDVHACHSCTENKQQQLSNAEGNVSAALEVQISRARRSIVGSLDALTGTKDRAYTFYETGKAHTLDTVDYLREESNILARVGAISAGGLLGLLLAARRGFFKKLIYGGSGMAAIASVCYPTAAGQISKGAFMIGKYYAYVAYQKLEDKVRTRSSWPSSSSSSSPTAAAKVEPSKPVENQKDAVILSSKKTKLNLAAGDIGQSNPEDADLYTTRGS